MRRVVLAVGAAVLGATWTTPSPADDRHLCLTSAEQGQQLRDDGKYAKAREAFGRCARSSCPALVQSDCEKWLAELEAASPSVVVIAKDDKGADLSAVKVTVDGAVLTTSLDGRPLAVDPGAHEFNFEASGLVPFDEHVVIHAGEKGRSLSVQFRSTNASVPGSSPSAPTGPATPSVPEATNDPGEGWRTAGWISVGVGAVSLIASGVSFGVRQAALDDAQNRCGSGYTGCPPNDAAVSSDSSRGKTASTLVTVFGIVGAVGIAGGLALVFTHPAHPQQARIIVSPSLGGATATWSF